MNSGFTLQGGELGHGHVPRRGRAVPIPSRRETASRVLQLGGDRSLRGTSAQGAGVASGRVSRPGLQAAVREEGRSSTWTARASAGPRAGRRRRDVRAAVACRTREGPARGHGDRPPSVCSRARPAGVAVPSPSWLSRPERGRRPGGRRPPAGPVYRRRRRHRRSWRRRPHDGLTGPGDRGRGSDQRLPAGLALRRRSGL